MKKILFVGDLDPYGRCSQRYLSLIELGYHVEGFSFGSISNPGGFTNLASLWKRIHHKLGIPVDKTGINKRILKYLKHDIPDLIWIEKGLMIRPATLKTIKKNLPNIRIVSYSEDDMFAKHNHSIYYLGCLPLYDFIFTTKSYNINSEELPSLGAKNVVFVEQAFDRNIHRPFQVNDKDRIEFGSDVSFVGSYEKTRAKRALFLAESNVKVRVWGNGWRKWVGKHPGLKIENTPLYNKNYIKALCATKINLGFLRKINRDLHTSRTFEIPACGGFMLAERTSEHQRLFEENKEAVYFDINNPKELLEKVRYYLDHEEERETIAKAGHKRCLKSGYSHHDRLAWMLKQVFLKFPSSK